MNDQHDQAKPIERLEIRGGEILIEMAERGERKAVGRGNGNGPLPLPTLVDLGVSKMQSSRWQKLATLTPEEQEQKIARAKQIAVAAVDGDKEVIRQVRAEQQKEKSRRRDERELELAGRQRALPQKRYGVIIADPEWRFEPWSRETGMDRAAENHYPTSCLA